MPKTDEKTEPKTPAPEAPRPDAAAKVQESALATPDADLAAQLEALYAKMTPEQRKKAKAKQRDTDTIAAKQTQQKKQEKTQRRGKVIAALQERLQEMSARGELHGDVYTLRVNEEAATIAPLTRTRGTGDGDRLKVNARDLAELDLDAFVIAGSDAAYTDAAGKAHTVHPRAYVETVKPDLCFYEKPCAHVSKTTAPADIEKHVKKPLTERQTQDLRDKGHIQHGDAVSRVLAVLGGDDAVNTVRLKDGKSLTVADFIKRAAEHKTPAK